ncbi:MAG: Ig-like domain repeat protein, partial [Terracidiphilus sp.]
AGGTYSGFGFNGTWNGTTNAVPTNFAVNGTACNTTLTSTTTALTSSATSVATGTSVTLTATVSPSTATGTVTFLDGTTSLGTGTLSSGKATLATSFSTAGTHSITAVYGGSTTFATSTSSAVSITVTTTLTATTTTLTSSATSVATGASVTLTATVSPSTATGTVTFLDGTTSLGTGTLSSGKATLATSFSTAGTHSITAVYGGSTTFATSTSSAVSITVTTTLTATTTTLTSSATSVATGTSVTLTATVSPSTATGTVTFLDGTTSLGTGTLSSGKATLATSFSTAGTHSITAVYGGSTTFATSTSSALSITVTTTLTATTTTLTSSATSVATGTSVTLTATVSPSTATGTVTFMSGTTSLGTGTLSSGVATLTTSFATAGTDSLTAVYGGSTTFATSTSSAVSITVTTTLTATTTTLTSSATSVATGTSVTLTASVSPTTATGTVTFMDGATSLGTGTLSSGKATLATSFSTAGTHSITAVYGGSSTFATSTSSAVSITVTSTGASFSLWATAATLSVPQNETASDTINVLGANGFTGAVTLAVSNLPTGVSAVFDANPTTGTSGIIFTVANTAAVTTSTITITGTSGTLTASTTIALTVTAAPATGSFVLTPSAPTLSLAAGSSSPETISITDISPFSGSVTLAASGLPAGVTATWTSNPSTSSGSLTLTAASTAAAGTSTITITGTSGSATASTTISLTVTAATGMACKIGWSVGSQSSSGSAGSFGGTITINNTGTTAWTSWTLTWTWPNGQTFQSLWGGTETQNGANVTITSLGYDGAIAAGGNTSQVGFNANWNGVTNAMPTNFAINGTTCSAVGSGSASGGSGFTLLAGDSPVTLNQGSSSTDTIAVEDFGGFTGSVTLSASGLPTGVTATFGTNPTTGSSVVTFTSAASLPAALTSITITGTSGTTTASAVIGLNVAGYSAVSVNTATKGIEVTDQLLGMDMAAWYDIGVNGNVIVDSFQNAGIKAVRWPGGSWSDVYHWQTNTNCQNAPYGGGTPDTNDTYANFINDIVIPAGLDVALTADYGTNPACTGGGVPSEAAAWAANSLSLGVTVSHMTIGNEVYGSTWEEDLHSPANNAAEYASTMIGSSGWYDTIKAASPNTLVGVAIDADNTAGGWDNTVLANAKGYYDFVEYHYYPEAPGQENDTTLIYQDAQQLTANINLIRNEMAEWGTPNTPIYIGEIGGPYGSPGKQSMSITQALFAGQVLGEMMNAGVSRLTWWIAYGGCADSTYGANFSSSLYGWQSFGGYMVFSDGLTDYYQCTAETLAPGILLPTARAFQLFSNVAVTGESVLSASVSGDTQDVVAYAATHSGGTAIVLFNRNETASQPVSITLSGQTTATSITVETYDKATYDLSGSPAGTPPDPVGTETWAGPYTTTISSPTLPLNLTLTPWSMNVVIIH